MFDTRKLYSITNGEWLLTLRRRDKHSAAECAKHRRMSRSEYLQLEADIQPYGPKGPDRLELNEVCFLYRRRDGRTQRAVAEAMGCCPYWLREMERGRQDCSSLLDFWEH